MPESDEPQQIGRYRVLGRIGAGGMGTVYAAHDPMLGREVAIKLARVDGPASLESRLLREARLLAQVRHPNVVELHDFGKFRGQIFIVMARIHGQTLRAWQRERERPWRHTVAMYVAAARGLQAAHAAGLVHRDFKADNVLVGDDGRVYVVDFGLARPAVEVTGDAPPATPPIASSSLDSPLTRTGAVVGTPAYMAPEQRAGRPPDVRSDIYSFCVSLYEALHGQRPEYRSDPTKTRAGKGDVPRRIDRALARGLAPAAAQRYATFEPLIAALERDPARWWRAVAVAVALLVTGGFAGLMASESEGPRAASCEAAARRIDAVWGTSQREALVAGFAAPGEYTRARPARDRGARRLRGRMATGAPAGLRGDDGAVGGLGGAAAPADRLPRARGPGARARDRGAGVRRRGGRGAGDGRGRGAAADRRLSRAGRRRR
nr:serine/threonine-protein kinase [Nannocystis pusilla]